MSAMHQTISTSLHWTEWAPLRDARRHPSIPVTPGLYRIRRVGFDGLDYIGQTGTTLRVRLGMLYGVYADEMPYRDPHTAAPGLWALRHATSCDFEVSVCPVEGRSDPWRKGLECVAISLYRQETGGSPTINFGRMPPGYVMSSGNNARLVAAGKVFRGGLTQLATRSHIAGVPPSGSLDGNPRAADWCGHAWSDWLPVAELPTIVGRSDEGLYRLWGQYHPGLLYIGEGRILSRVMAHIAKIGTPDSRQGPLLAAAGQLDASVVVNPDWHSHQREELETDLIASHMLAYGEPPLIQFLGR